MVEENTIEDSALAAVGGYKRWHVAMFVLVSTAIYTQLVFNSLSIVFQGWEPAHICTGSGTHKNNDSSHWHGIQNKNDVDYKCRVISEDLENGTTTASECNAWSYKNDGYYTIVEQWNLVCQQNYLAELSQALYQVGCLIGELLLFVIDKYGRKKIHLITHFIIGVVGIINAFSVSYAMFVISKTVLGIFVAINATSGMMLSLEFFDSTKRTLPGIIQNCFWTGAYITLPGLAYVIKNWMQLQLTIAAISFLLALPILLIPESPIWLASKGETKNANAILRKVAKWNNIDLDPQVSLLSEEPYMNPKRNSKTNEDDLASEVSTLKESTREKKTFQNILDLTVIKFLVISSAFWLGVNFAFYGIILLTPSMDGNRFYNFLLVASTEVPSMLLACFLSKTIGRRITSSLALFTTALLLITRILIPTYSDATRWITLLLVILSKGVLTAVFAVMLLYTKEIFPTNIRGTCCGICQIWGRVGAFSAPMAAYLGKTDLHWLPNILFGLTCLMVGLLVLLLPETNNQPLPQSIEDCHRLNKERSLCRFR